MSQTSLEFLEHAQLVWSVRRLFLNRRRHCIAIALFLCGIGIRAHAEATLSMVGTGVSVSGNRVMIDGAVLDPSVRVYISPKTGVKYLVSRKDDSVSVTSSQISASVGKGKSNGITIEARASSGAVKSDYGVTTK